MSDEQQRHPHASAAGGWQPIPRGGELDAEGTTFVQLPPELLAHPGTGAGAGAQASWGPLAAPGTGYAPPVADTWQQPVAAPVPVAHGGQHGGQWDAPAYEAPYGHAGVPADSAPGGADDGGAADPHATEQWPMPFAAEDGQGGQAGHEVQFGHDLQFGHDGQADPFGHEAQADPFGHDGQVGQFGHDGQASHGGQIGHDVPFGHDVQGGYEAQAGHGGQPGRPGQFGHDGQMGHDVQADPFGHDVQAGHDIQAGRFGHDVPFGHEVPPGHGGVPAADPAVTGQWSVPAAGDDSVDESGEYPLREAGLEARHEYAAPVGEVTGAGDDPTGEWTTAARAEAPTEGDPAPESPEPPLDHAAPDATSPDHAAPAAPEAATPAPEPVAEPTAEPVAEPEPEAVQAPAAEAPAVAPEAVAEPVPVPEQYAGPEAYAAAGAQPEPPLEAQPEPQPEALLQPHNEHPCASYVLHVNGTDRPVTDAWIGESLLYVLRERLGLAGAKDGCSQGECGACSVQVDGRLVASCLVPAATTAGSEIRTVEGLAQHGQPSDVQRALAECGAVQCGFCVPGLAMTVHDLLEGNHAPTEMETRQAICGNLCRCSGYRGVLQAVRQVVDERAEAAAALEETQQQQPDAATTDIPHQAGPYGPYGDGSDSGDGRAMA
ncbi:2Fe-2S iron-sulfur cluster-binding protein [Streptomyces griseocarneus]|nr:2Fe-2S iron-sulfur cluster-binding protein [Streptomyces griseocarneus]